ncbi:flagellar filament capping protein FliD [Chromobacterium violaceum]|uniref:Flagellar hook-associated protein 2 n=2 Tax=Chromobacterium violaceum TaxID=536 RepID=Q7NRA7_CHRVO|nr:flagellar filament capping protein FliD [Chromobacterium violaceum]AAQ61538.1 probable flagellar protein [Chromobacterium violaceum ATCC 12472]KJH66114.1 flagellar protein [Chromobacterium violaceum]MBP4043476.1 flagellar filament capping protein FliD [Chromobacterium violaceum]MBX9269426.1 flagellar filament capping protein FliD [Chromobacterium violaceum]OVE46454.1 flagellar protein [Chromobacterium violaceum]
MAAITSSVGALDVQGIVSQLMAIERRPLNESQQRADQYNTQLSTVGKLSSSLSALQTALTGLSSGRFLQVFKATVSDASMGAVSTTSGGSSGTYQIDVKNLATSRQLVFDQVGTSTITDPKAAISGAPDSISFQVNGKTQTVTLRSKPDDVVSLQTINDKINAAGIGINASVVQNGSQYKLVLGSVESGLDNQFKIVAGSNSSDSGGTSGSTLAGLSQSPTAGTESRDASNASLTVNGVAISAGSNKVTSAVAGVEIDLYKAGSFTVSLSPDSAGVAKNLQSFVDAYNQVIGDVKAARSGALKGNASILDIQGKLQQVLATPVAGVDPVNSIAYLSQAGISLQKDGTLKLDQTAFNDAMKKDKQAVVNLFGNASNTGFAQRFNLEINGMLDPKGVIETSKATIRTKVSTETQLQSSLQSRLDTKQAQLIRQYTALNKTLAEMQSGSSSLFNLISSK